MLLDEILLQVHSEFRTWTTGHLAGDVTKLNLSDVNDRLRAAAAQSVENHSDVLVDLGSEGELIVNFEPPEGGGLHSYQIQHANELGRIAAQVREKAAQGRGVEPLWLRFATHPNFHSGLPGPRCTAQDTSHRP